MISWHLFCMLGNCVGYHNGICEDGKKREVPVNHLQSAYASDCKLFIRIA